MQSRISWIIDLPVFVLTVVSYSAIASAYRTLLKLCCLVLLPSCGLAQVSWCVVVVNDSLYVHYSGNVYLY